MLDHFAGVWRIGAGLYYSCISRCQSVHKRGDRQHERIIPWTHDQCYTIRRRLLITPGMELRKRCPDCFFSGKTFRMLQHIADLFSTRPVSHI